MPQMEEQNTDSDSQSVASNQSASSSSSKHKQSGCYGKEGPSRLTQGPSKRKHEEEGKVGSTPKRKKIDGTDPAGAGAVTPGSSSARKAAPLSERQQMVLALAMSAQESGGTSPVQVPPATGTTTDTTPRSAALRRVNRRNEKGESPLHRATIKGDVEAMTDLLEAGAGVNVPDYAGWTALHEACNHGFVNAAKLLLEKGANVDAQGLDNDTPLHDAAINGNPKLVSLLLKYGANPYQGNMKGKSALDVAINDDIKQLLKKEATVTADKTDPLPEQLLVRKEDTLPNEPGLPQTNTDVFKTEDSISHSADSKGTLSPTLHSTDQTSAQPEPCPLSSNTTETTEIAPLSSPSSTSTSSHPSTSRHSSTGFIQEDCEVPSDAARAGQDTSSKPTMLATLESDRQATSTSQSPCQSPQSTEAQGRQARQSLDFTPIKAATSTESAEQSMADSTTEPSEATAVSNSSIDETKNETGQSSAAPIESTDESKSGESGTSESTNNDKYTTESMDTNEALPTDKQEVEEPAEAAEAADGETQNMRELGETDKKSPVADQEEDNKTNTSTSSAESKPVEQVKGDKPQTVSPTIDKAQRARTGSMHRKRRQAQSIIHTSESPVQPEGDNSKDSTDSHISASNVTRASRSRNKQQQATSQPPEEEPIPARETRRKTMMKERSAASSPSTDKSSKTGLQKVPPLTIKLAGKSPANTTATSVKDTASTVSMSTAGGEPYVMLADKETERANSALAKEQAKSPESPEGFEIKEKKQDTVTFSSQSHASSLSILSTTTTSGVTTRKLRSHTNRNHGAVGEKLEDQAPPRKSKRMKTEQAASVPSQPPSLPPPPGPLTIFNPYNLFRNVRERMFKKWEKIVSVNPRTPTGYSRYIINTKKYMLHNNATTNASKLAIPLLAAPSHISQPMKELFNKQEQERYKLRHQHLIEGEKLRIAYEQEVVRVYTRGARAAVNQETPLSVCTILKDKESGTVYHPFNALKERMVDSDLYPWPFLEDGSSTQNPSEEKGTEKSARSHFNNRQLISWIQDVEDKFEKLKDQMLSRHHHESESLYAVQTMDWEWKLKEVGICDYKAQPTNEMLHVPMVPVNDDADILNSS